MNRTGLNRDAENLAYWTGMDANLLIDAFWVLGVVQNSQRAEFYSGKIRQ